MKKLLEPDIRKSTFRSAGTAERNVPVATTTSGARISDWGALARP
jgi:hypothetical protein